MSSIQEIKNKSHLFEQVELMRDNILHITITTIKILKSTVLKDFDIRIMPPTKIVCNFFKFITANLCGITELSHPLTQFFSIIKQSFIPKELSNLDIDALTALYKNQLVDNKIKVDTNYYEPIDKQSTINLRTNLINFVNKVIQNNPNINKNLNLDPVCETSKYITQQVCEYSYILIPFIIFMSLLSHLIIPDKVMNEIVNSLTNTNNITTNINTNNTNNTNNINNTNNNIVGGRRRTRKTYRK